MRGKGIPLGEPLWACGQLCLHVTLSVSRLTLVPQVLPCLCFLHTDLEPPQTLPQPQWAGPILLDPP